MPFKDPHPEDDQDILDIIDELIDTDPYGASKSLSSAFSGLRGLAMATGGMSFGQQELYQAPQPCGFFGSTLTFVAACPLA